MINLLPPKSQSRVRREYWIRVLSVWGILLACVFVVAVLLLSPSYVLLSSGVKALDLELKDNSEAEKQFSEAKKEIDTAGTYIKRLEAQQSLASITDIVRTVASVTGEEIELRRYVINREKETEHTIQVQGTADSRSALAEFKTALEREALFESAVVPISDLAREQDLPFVLTLTIAAIRR